MSMRLPKLILAATVFSAICLSSCKLPPLGSYVDPLFLEEDNPDAKDLSEKK